VRILAAAALLACASPCFAEPAFDLRLHTPEWQSTHDAAKKWEFAYLALSAIDTAETVRCLDQGICHEGNPLFGKHPSAAKLIAAKVVLGGLHFAIFTRLNEHNPKAALRLAQVSATVQGGVVLLNARFSFGGGK
jgi:hypothetical protein